jgi:hypothetical protein
MPHWIMAGQNAPPEGLQAVPDAAKEGLPYWTFWLLLCIILLLVFFIFLRDKDLRRRLSAFLSGAKRRMIRMRLSARIRKEKDKKTALWKELGRKAWSEEVRVEGMEETFQNLSALETDLNKAQADWQVIYERIDALEKAHEESRRVRNEEAKAEEALYRPLEERLSGLLAREKDLAKRRAADPKEDAGLAAEIASARADLGRFREKAAGMKAAGESADREAQAEVRAWTKQKEDVQERIIGIKKSSEPLYECLGRALDEARIEHKNLALIYFQIDSVGRTIRDLQDRIERLS